MRTFAKQRSTFVCSLSLCFLLAACESGAAAPAAIPADPASKPTKTSSKDSHGSGSKTAPPGPDSSDPSDAPAADTPAIARSTRSSLQWKRYAAFEADLSQALDLPKAELCNEFGKEPCIRSVHLSPLGGHNPITTGLLEGSAEPLVTTSTVVERVVLSACIARVDKDRQLGSAAVVFGGLQLDGPAPAPDAPALRNVINGLYQRFLARDAEPTELDTLAALARDEKDTPVTGAAFATSACMVVGSQSEFLFF